METMLRDSEQRRGRDDKNLDLATGRLVDRRQVTLRRSDDKPKVLT